MAVAGEPLHAHAGRSTEGGAAPQRAVQWGGRNAIDLINGMLPGMRERARGKERGLRVVGVIGCFSVGGIQVHSQDLLPGLPGIQSRQARQEVLRMHLNPTN